jgi:hypothetical protein
MKELELRCKRHNSVVGFKGMHDSALDAPGRIRYPVFKCPVGGYRCEDEWFETGGEEGE